jgi:hypothetical protein
MVFNDGHGDVVGRARRTCRRSRVLDNLIFRREIPVIVRRFHQSGPAARPAGAESEGLGRRQHEPARRVQPSQRPVRPSLVVEELLPALRTEFNISPDPELHGIMGASSGGCALFARRLVSPERVPQGHHVSWGALRTSAASTSTELVAASERKPSPDFSVQAGRNDNRRPGRPEQRLVPPERGASWTRLTKKGYDVDTTRGSNRESWPENRECAIVPGDDSRWLWRDQHGLHLTRTMPRSRSFRNPKDTVGRELDAARSEK